MDVTESPLRELFTASASAAIRVHGVRWLVLDL